MKKPNQVKKILRLLTPPILWILFHKIKVFFFDHHRKSENFLFDGDDNMFKKWVKLSKNYVEYGVGRSTIWVVKNTCATITCVDSSKEWLDFIESSLPKNSNDRITLKYVDIGKLKDWGRPIGYSKRMNFRSYIEFWGQDQETDLVLIDGRFRVACFFYCLLSAKPGTKIIIDDYTLRHHYHIIEEIIKPTEIDGRQFLFTVPDNLNRNLVETLYPNFIYVTE